MSNVKRYGNTTIELLNIDIVDAPVEVFVNAANTRLWMGGGIAGALLHAAGDSVQLECNRYGQVAMGEVVVTGSGRIAARHIFHAAVTDDDADLRSDLASVQESIQKIISKIGELKVRSIAVPLLGAGVGGLQGADVALEIVKAFESHGTRSSEPLRVIIPVRNSGEFQIVKGAFDAYTDARAERQEIERLANEMVRRYEQKLKGPDQPPASR